MLECAHTNCLVFVHNRDRVFSIILRTVCVLNCQMCYLDPRIEVEVRPPALHSCKLMPYTVFTK